MRCATSFSPPACVPVSVAAIDMLRLCDAEGPFPFPLYALPRRLPCKLPGWGYAPPGALFTPPGIPCMPIPPLLALLPPE